MLIGRRCCGNGLSGGGRGGGPNDFLAGGPKFEVTPLFTDIDVLSVSALSLSFVYDER